ncbi:GNAT family N-acetyltransferase [Microbacterium sp. NPDC056569]|uniref:GNAT family N-acetyltransferase n=1 Tax=Microbacterium sp. NPDC056569 TaxID=3345867 RepID=UPI00366C396F
MTFTLRVPEPRDAAEIAELHVATWRETYTHLLPAGFFDAEFAQGRRSMWTRILDDPRDEWRIRIAEREGRIIGFATSGPGLEFDGKAPPCERQLYMLYVAAADHGGGAGQALLDAVLDAGPAVLWVAKDNPRAIAFYRRNGFELDGAEQTDPMVPSIIDVRMVR